MSYSPAQKRHPAGSPSSLGGKFAPDSQRGGAAAEHARPGRATAEDVERMTHQMPERRDGRFSVEDRWGDVVELSPDTSLDEVRDVFRQGQCLAYATALSKSLGTDRVVTLYNLEDGEELDDDGNETFDEIPHHVLAVDQEGRWHDVDGVMIVEDVSRARQHFEVVESSAEDAVRRFSGYLAEQNYEFAAACLGE